MVIGKTEQTFTWSRGLERPKAETEKLANDGRNINSLLDTKNKSGLCRSAQGKEAEGRAKCLQLSASVALQYGACAAGNEFALNLFGKYISNFEHRLRIVVTSAERAEAVVVKLAQ
jgi:hypothetical protein